MVFHRAFLRPRRDLKQQFPSTFRSVRKSEGARSCRNYFLGSAGGPGGHNKSTLEIGPDGRAVISALKVAFLAGKLQSLEGGAIWFRLQHIRPRSGTPVAIPQNPGVIP
jgi:hypothetical protein